MPTTTCEKEEIINYEHYSVSFCEEFGLSEWSIYLTNTERLLGDVPRTNKFRVDPNLSGRGADNSFYKYNIYDRGHLVPAADMKFSKQAMSESFLFTNIVPQLPRFNRGIWLKLEKELRKFTYEKSDQFGDILVITGWNINNYNDSILVNSPTELYWPVPDFFYKVYIDVQNKRSIAFLINQKDSEYKELHSYTVPIHYLEEQTGLDFFYKLPVHIEMKLELDTGNK